MSKYEMSSFEDFKRILVDKEAMRLFVSRSLFEEASEGQLPDGKMVKQNILTGYIILAAENANSDVMRFAYLLPPYPTDRTKERIEKIRAAINAAELSLVKEIEQLNPAPQIYAGTIEDRNKSIAASLNQVAAIRNSLDQLIQAIYMFVPKQKEQEITEAEAAALVEREAEVKP